MLEPPILSRAFFITSVSWSVAIIGMIIYNFIEKRYRVWNYLIIIQQIVSWLVLLVFLIDRYVELHQNLLKTLKYVFLVISGPYLLSATLYGFMEKDKFQQKFYATSFIIWWILFSVSVYCSFKLTLDVALYYHRSKKAKYYESIEAPCSPLLK